MVTNSTDDDKFLCFYVFIPSLWLYYMILAVLDLIYVIVYFDMKNNCWFLWEIILYSTICNILTIPCVYFYLYKYTKPNNEQLLPMSPSNQPDQTDMSNYLGLRQLFQDIRKNNKYIYYFSRFLILPNIILHAWILITFFSNHVECDNFWKNNAKPLFNLFYNHFIFTFLIIIFGLSSLCTIF